jgi:hypothetical protein
MSAPYPITTVALRCSELAQRATIELMHRSEKKHEHPAPQRLFLVASHPN